MGVEVQALKTLLSEYDSNLLEASSTLEASCQPEENLEIFIKTELFLIFLHEKVIYGYVFNWSIEII